MEMSDIVVCRDRLWLGEEVVNSEQCKELINASRNMDSKTLSMEGDR